MESFIRSALSMAPESVVSRIEIRLSKPFRSSVRLVLIVRVFDESFALVKGWYFWRPITARLNYMQRRWLAVTVPYLLTLDLETFTPRIYLWHSTRLGKSYLNVLATATEWRSS